MLMWKYLLSTDFIPVIVESFKKLNRIDCQLDTKVILTNYFILFSLAGLKKEEGRNRALLTRLTVGSWQSEFLWHWFSGHAVSPWPWNVPSPERVKCLRYWKEIQLCLSGSFARPAGAWANPWSRKEIGALQGPSNSAKLTKYFPGGTNTVPFIPSQFQASLQEVSKAYIKLTRIK